ncbi:C-reactive protein-like protein [Lates japonicus]|uniref:C-reactive protein-like protein n=1 Tax=Lates japonicus TaxID=270547 RepID=A0AAD3N1K8_LATJO|nr:C-reactive protein-like protein [Lates japonicus]
MSKQQRYKTHKLIHCHKHYPATGLQMAPFLLLVMVTVCAAVPQDLSGKVFTFPQETNTAHVRLTTSRQDFSAVTVCHRSFTDLKRDHALFSLSTPSHQNDILIYWEETNKQMKPHIRDRQIGYGGWDYKPYTWHSVCTTWDSASGLVQLWFDGQPSTRRFINSGSNIGGSPIIILAQDQDSHGDLRRDHSLFSLATPSNDNDFLIFKSGANDEIALYIRGNHAGFGGQEYKLNMWHSICSTWDSASGVAQLWLDGKPSSRKFFSSGSNIRGPIIMVLGQEQDSHGGAFDINQSLVGMTSDVHILKDGIFAAYGDVDSMCCKSSRSVRFISSGSNITGSPVIVLGQEQDSLGGGFDIKQSFIGMMTDVHMWDYVLSSCEIHNYVDELNFTPGNVLNWRALGFRTTGKVLVENQLIACHS